MVLISVSYDVAVELQFLKALEYLLLSSLTWLLAGGFSFLPQSSLHKAAHHIVSPSISDLRKDRQHDREREKNGEKQSEKERGWVQGRESQGMNWDPSIT